MIHDYHKRPLKIGDSIRNIESGWHGIIRETQGDGPDLMLICYGINWLAGTVDEDDKQWHAPADVIKANRQPDRTLAPNSLNFLG